MRRSTCVACVLTGVVLFNFALRPGDSRPDAGAPSAGPADRIRRIENGLAVVRLSNKEPPVQLTLQDVMALTVAKREIARERDVRAFDQYLGPLDVPLELLAQMWVGKSI